MVGNECMLQAFCLTLCKSLGVMGITVFYDVMPSSLIITSVSEEHSASIFTEEIGPFYLEDGGSMFL
jgi:hypothetical protein